MHGTNKVPHVTLAFWVIKIFATTLGETGGDAVSMSMHLGYAVSTLIFFAIFMAAVAAQVSADKFHPFLYWAVIIATTTTGTTISDYLDRTAGLGYIQGSLLLLVLLTAILALWRVTTGTVSVSTITTAKAEIFYWVTILISNTLGTALGDYTATTAGLGFEGGALVFAGLLTAIAVAYFFTQISRTLLFWAAFILTRPLGATLGDLLTKPFRSGGLHLDRISSSLIIAVVIVGFVHFTSRRPGQASAA
jgi:uncharacterized membrane-anchored protein